MLTLSITYTMRIALSILLFVVFSFHNMMKLSVITVYELNKEYIAQNLCVNKDKPELQCNGKCYLKKQLDKTDQNSKTDNKSNSLKADITDIVLCNKNILLSSLHLSEPTQTHSIYSKKFIETDHIYSFFRPPEASS